MSNPTEAKRIIEAALLCAAFLAGFWLQGVRFIDHSAQTYDEANHIAAGCSNWGQRRHPSSKSVSYWLPIMPAGVSWPSRACT